MKKLIIISLTIMMFFFKNSAMSNNQKSFYDLEIESINGEIIKLKDYRDKVFLECPQTLLIKKKKPIAK